VIEHSRVAGIGHDSTLGTLGSEPHHFQSAGFQLADEGQENSDLDDQREKANEFHKRLPPFLKMGGKSLGICAAKNFDYSVRVHVHRTSTATRNGPKTPILQRSRKRMEASDLIGKTETI
jgi:hypothetical protein